MGQNALLFLSVREKFMKKPVIKYFLILNLLLLSCICNAQEDNFKVYEERSLNSVPESNNTILKHNNEMRNSLFYFDKMEFDQYIKFSNNWASPLYHYKYQSENTHGSINLLMQKEKLLSALQTKINFERKDDLGLFGQILGYVNIAAAASLAVIHLNKYYWQNNEKKKETKKKP